MEYRKKERKSKKGEKKDFGSIKYMGIICHLFTCTPYLKILKIF